MSDQLTLDIRGKVIAITGASSGIGEATALRLAAHGARLALGARRTDRLEALAAKIREQGGDVLVQTLDVTQRESFEGFLDVAEAAFGPVDVLVNNAGIMVLGPFAEEDDETAHRMVDVNLHGVLLGTKLALARMRLGRLGVSSIHGGDRGTFRERAAFFSFRRDGRCGRMATLIWIE